MNPFYRYIEKLLAEHLKKRRVAVWYDHRREFTAFVAALTEKTPEADGIATVAIGDMAVSLARYEGSFFAVKSRVEPLVCVDLPEPLLIYIPGVPQDLKGSVLMELEKAGECFEWPLKRLARFCLQEKFSDGMIDQMLGSEKTTYGDIVAFFSQDNGGPPSMLKTLFEGAKDNAAIVARWLCDQSLDDKIIEKGATSELFNLIKSRLGMDLGIDMNIGEARDKMLRYVLVGEFRDDLSGDPPTTLSMIPEPPTRDHLQILRKTAQAMRDNHPDAYARMAHRVEKELDLKHQPIAPEALGRIDTFPFEEKAVLKWIGDLILTGQHDKALSLMDERKRNFWADRDLERQAQWAACRLMAVLADEVSAVRNSLMKPKNAPIDWVNAYCHENGWRRMDLAQQQLEAWVAKMMVDPEAESSLEKVRQLYEDVVQDMAAGFMEALERSGWTIPGILHQAEVYPKVVEAEKSPTAYFLVDAMRYAMAQELVEMLAAARDVAIKPAIAAWPTITPMGMAALLPGAAAGFNVHESEGRFCARIDDVNLPDVSARMKYFKVQVPEMVDMQLEKLLAMSAKKLQETVPGVSLFVVRSQEIDTLGEISGGLIARQVMDTMVGNVARAVRKLADCGITRFVITADHGHLFTRKKEDAFKTDPPGGQTIEIHRRCWIGKGGATPAGTIRLSASELGYAGNLEFIFPKGIGVFKTGGDLGFHHGGLSLQEVIVPVISFRMGKERPATGPAGEIVLSGTPEKLTNRTFGIQLDVGGLFKQSYTVRPLLISKGVIVGKAGMALDADFDQTTACVTLRPPKKASVAMILENESCKEFKVVIQDPATDRVLAQSKDIVVVLGTV
jgi:hypothetical protein